MIRNHAAHRAFWKSMLTKGKRGNLKHAIDAVVAEVDAQYLRTAQEFREHMSKHMAKKMSPVAK